MRISNQPILPTQKNKSYANNIFVGSLSCQKTDIFTPSPSFTALKKSAFNGIDFAVVEKFKAPIEKFESLKDFDDWAKEEFYKICCKKYGGRNYATELKRESLVSNWEQELNFDDKYTNPERLLIINSVTKGMKPNNEVLCPVFNKTILNKTLYDLKDTLQKDKKQQFDFGKLYKNNLREMYLENSKVGENESKWIIIPSKINDPEHFKENVEKLQTLSCDEWCTKNGGASIYLHDGDFHIYLDKGKPKLAIRFDEDIVKEVNGEMNDYVIPNEYVDILDKYMKKNDFLTTQKVDDVMKKSKIRAESDKVADEVPNFGIKPNLTEKKNKQGFFSKVASLFGF